MANREEEVAHPRGQGKCRVLLVDDDPDIREFVSSLLEHAGFVVATASNGAVALELLDHETSLPELILLDRHMPVLDGDGLAARLRERDPGARIIAFTSSPDGDQWAKRLRAVGYVLKPFLVAELLVTIDRLCPYRRWRRRRRQHNEGHAPAFHPGDPRDTRT